MKFILTSCLSLLLFASCKSHSPVVSSMPSDAQVSAGSCKIEASVVEIIKPSSQDTSDVCFKNSCEAIVHVERIMHCGSAASVTPDEKGEIKVHFPNSLNPAGNGSQASGSKQAMIKGSVFTAVVEIHQAPGDKINYVVYIYEVR